MASDTARDRPPQANGGGPQANDRATGDLKTPTGPLPTEVTAPAPIPRRYFTASLLLRATEVAIFLVAVIGAVALGLGITDYFSDHHYVFAYLLAYAGFRFSDLLVREDPDEVAKPGSAETFVPTAREELSHRITMQLPLLLMFAAAPFERTYVYGGEAPGWLAALGLLLELLGMWLALGARIQLGFLNYPATGNRPILVRSGFYRYIRHPIYAGTFLVSFGWPLEYGAPVSALLTVIIGAIFVYRRMKAEQSILIARFGEDYEAYMRETDALIPTLW
jgi:protein-S-isoprenylcysteine O-methyltransferase Ste14